LINKYYWHNYKQNIGIGDPNAKSPGDTWRENGFSLGNVVDDSYQFFEALEKKHGGDIENFLGSTRNMIEKGKVKIEKREQKDPLR